MAPKRSKSSVDFDSNLFVSAKSAKLFRDVYNGSPLSHEYHLDPTLLGSNIACVGTWLRAIGLFDLLTTTNYVYPDLVAYFYANLEDGVALFARSFIKGNPVVLDMAVVSNALRVPSIGAYSLTNYDPLEALQVVLNDSDFANPLHKLKVADLDPPTRILHLLISHTILPRAGSHANISAIDLGLLYYIKSGTQINFPMIFFKYLHKKKNHSPYPVFLSRIFAFLRLHNSRDRRIHKNPQSTLSSDTLRRCKIVYQNQEWVRANQPPSADDEDEEEHEDAPPAVQEDVLHLSGPSSSSRPAEPFWQDLLARMDSITENQAILLANQQRQQEWMTAMDERWFQQFPPPPPPSDS